MTRRPPRHGKLGGLVDQAGRVVFERLARHLDNSERIAKIFDNAQGQAPGAFANQPLIGAEQKHARDFGTGLAQERLNSFTGDLHVLAIFPG